MPKGPAGGAFDPLGHCHHRARVEFNEIRKTEPLPSTTSRRVSPALKLVLDVAPEPLRFTPSHSIVG
jgi:hypothetical protein